MGALIQTSRILSVGLYKDDLQEANLTAAVEVSAAKEKNKETLQKLEEIKKIDDKRERLRRLAELVG